MRIETLLYVYLFICSGMIVFNIITAIVLKRRDRRTVRASAPISAAHPAADRTHQHRTAG